MSMAYDMIRITLTITMHAVVIVYFVLLNIFRSAGFDRVDTKAALAYGVSLARVPAYSPYAVAEFAITLLMSVNRKIIRATSRVKMANFSLDSGLIGTDIHGKVSYSGLCR